MNKYRTGNAMIALQPCGSTRNQTKLTLGALAAILALTLSTPGQAQGQSTVEPRVAQCPAPPKLTNSVQHPALGLVGVPIHSSLDILLKKYGAPAEGKPLQRAKAIGDVEEFPDRTTDFTVSRQIEWKLSDGEVHKFPADFFYFCYGTQGSNALFKIEVHFIPNELKEVMKKELDKIFGPAEVDDYLGQNHTGWVWPRKTAKLQPDGYVAYDAGTDTEEGSITLCSQWGTDEGDRRLKIISESRKAAPATKPKPQ